MRSDDPESQVVEKIIKEFHDLDRTVLAFLYSRDNNGVLIAFANGTIDLENTRDVMETMRHFFDGADGQLDAHSSAAGYCSGQPSEQAVVSPRNAFILSKAGWPLRARPPLGCVGRRPHYETITVSEAVNQSCRGVFM